MTLKSIFLLLAVTLCFFAQAQNIHFGLTGSVNVTDMEAKGLSSKWQTGFDGGAFAAINLNKKWVLQPEVLFTEKIAQKADDFLTYYVNEGLSVSNTNLHLYYISIPVLLSYHINHLITINAGPEYSIKTYSDDDLLYDGKSVFKNNEAGVTAGVQVMVSPTFHLFGSYYYALTNINNINDRYQWHDSQLHIGIEVRIM